MCVIAHADDVCFFKAPRTQPRSSERWFSHEGHGRGSGGTAANAAHYPLPLRPPIQS